MRNLLIATALLPATALAIYYPQGYTNPQTVPTNRSHIQTLSAIQFQQGITISRTATTLRARLCDPNFGAPNRRLPSWCANMQTNMVPQTVPAQRTQVMTNTYFQSNVPQGSIAPFATVNAYKQTAPQSISSDVIDVFRINITQPSISGRSFQAATNVETMDLRLTSSNISNVNWNDFQVVANGEVYPIGSQGNLTIDVARRLTGGDNIELNVGVRLKPASIYPVYSGSFQMELIDINAFRENSNIEMDVKIDGTPRSQFFSFSPFPATQTGAFVQIRAEGEQNVTLTSGGVFDLMRISIEPQFAGVRLNELMVMNTTGTDARNVFDRLYLVDANTGELLDSGTFSQQTVDFKPLRNLAQFEINTRRELVVRGLVQDTIPAGSTIELVTSGSSFDLQSTTSGFDITTSQINFVTTPGTLLTATEGTVNIRHSAIQPTVLLSTGTPQSVYQFTISNPSQEDMYIGRLSLAVLLDGLDWPGNFGPTTNDFRIVTKGDQFNTFSSGLLATSVTSQGEVTFDALSTPVIIRSNQTKTFELQVATERTGNRNDDAVTVLWREDGTTSAGDLQTLRNQNRKTIYTTDDFLQTWRSDAGLEIPYDAVQID